MNIYVVKDVLASSVSLTFMAENDQLCKRVIEGYICSPTPNMVNTFVDDKQVYLVATLDKATMQVKPVEPTFVFNVFEIRDSVLKDLCRNEQFVKAQLHALDKQKEVINGKPIKRKAKQPEQA